MADVERIEFDFSGDGFLESSERLERILRSGHWSDIGPNYEDERTRLLLRLLDIGGIVVYKRIYNKRTDASPELRRRAGEISLFMHKEYAGQTLIDIAGIFSDYEYDAGRTTYNSLFFPELKAFVRCGGLSPEKLFELLEQDGCDAVMLFPEAYGEDFFYAFSRAMPRENFLNALEEMQGNILEAMHEALRRAEKNGSLPSFPVFPDIEETE